MEHSYFKDRISAFHDNELKHEEKQLIAEHLETCAECQQLLEQLRKFDGMVEKHSGLADDDYWEKSARKIEAAIGGETTETEVIEVEPSFWKGLGWKLAGVAASLAVIAFIALYEGEISDEVRKDTPLDSQAMKITMPPPSDSLADTEADQPTLELAESRVAEGDFAPAEEPLVVKEDRAPSPTVGIPKPVADGAAEDADEGYVAAKPSEIERVISEPPETAGTDDAVPTKPRSPLVPATEEEFAGVPKLSIIKVEKGKTHVVTEMEPDTKDLGVEITVKGEVGLSGIRKKSRSVTVSKDSAEAVSREAPATVLEEASPSAPLDVDELFRAAYVEFETLRSWRVKRDSLEAVLADLGSLGSSQITRLEGKKKITAAAADQRELKEMVDSVSSEISWRDPQLQLLESHYEIARLTKDKKEYKASVQYLKDYLEREDATFKLHAAWYLQQLDESE